MRVVLAVVAVLVLAFGWLIGLDQFVMRLWLVMPVLFSTLGLLVVWIVWNVAASNDEAPLVLMILVFVVGLLGDLVGNGVRSSAFASRYERRLTQLTSAPDSTFLPRRALPLPVAEQFARSVQTDARYEYGAFHPTMSTAPTRRGRLVWQAPLHPTSLSGYWSSGLAGVVEVDADTASPQVTVHALALPVGGEGNFSDFSLVVHRSIDALAIVGAPVYDIADSAAIVPLMRHVWGIRSFTGVAVFHANGDIQQLTRAEADQRYPHLRLYPEVLVAWESSTWGAWRRGFRGFLNLVRDGVYEVAALGDNPAPTLLDDARRAWWVVPMEPTGNSHGLAGLLFVDPANGSTRWWNTAALKVMSPSQALTIAHGDTRIAVLKDAVALEPMLVLRHQRISWLVPVVPANFSQVQAFVLVDAITRVTLVAPTYAQIVSPATSNALGVSADGSPPPTAGMPTATVRALIVHLRSTLDSLERALDAVPRTSRRPAA